MKILPLVSLGLFVAVLGGAAYGQTPPPITSSGLNTQISAPVILPGGAVQHNITGGTRPGGGGNLFHSFGEFGVPTNNVANFLNDSGLPTNNILSRVTGGHPSNIFGTIKTDGFGKANLFLMNPAGIVFGQDASLNVGGATYFTTADYLKLNDGVQFTAMPSAQDALLSIAPIAAFGFLGTNPGAILVEALSVSEGQSLSLIGGNIAIDGGLNAPRGQITLASVASPGEVTFTAPGESSDLRLDSFEHLGAISFSGGAFVNTNGEGGGTVVIRGGRLTLDQASIATSTIGPTEGVFTGQPGSGVDIQVTGDVVLDHNSVIESNVFTTVEGLGSGGIRIKADHVDIRNEASLQSTVFPGSMGGKSGDIYVEANSLRIQDFGLIESSTEGKGDSGNIFLNIAQNLEVLDGGLIGADAFAGSGNAGNIEVHADTVLLSNVNNSEITGISSSTNLNGIDPPPTGHSGTIRIVANNLEMIGTESSANPPEISTISFGPGHSGTIDVTVKEGNLAIDNGNIYTQTTGSGDAGNIGVTVEKGNLSINGRGQIHSETHGGGGNTGNIHVEVREGNALLDDGGSVFTTIVGGGKGGNIQFEAVNLNLNNTSFISVQSDSPQKAGNIALNLSESLTLKGRSEIDALARGQANAGDVTIAAKNTILITQGSLVSTESQTQGGGGTLNLETANLSITDGGVISSAARASGNGGDITIHVGEISLTNGASITAESTSTNIDAGNAGNIQLTAAGTILLDKATVTTEAAQASGGKIKLTANDTIQLVDSSIESTVKGDAATVAGNIELDPDFIILQNSHILAKATDGQGGNITLIASKGVLVDAQSTLEVTSERGISGTVNIESPIQVLSGTIVPLPSTPVNVATLYAARCVAGEGGHFSTFVDSKAASVAPTPGSFLASPFLPVTSSSTAGSLGHTGTPPGGNAAFLQLAAYTPPVLFAQAMGQPAPCP